MHLKTKYVEDIWDHDPGVDLADITLQLGEIDVEKAENEKPKQDVVLKRMNLSNEPVISKTESPAKPASPSRNARKMNTFPRAKKSVDDALILNPRKYLFLNDYSFNCQKHKQLKEKIASAVKRKNIFSIHGPFPALRKALKKRNWLEKKIIQICPGL